MTLHLVSSASPDRVRQGDIYRNVPYYESYRERDGEFELTVYEFPYVIVLTQDCDLEQNKSARSKIIPGVGRVQNDKHLISIIVAPLYNAEHLFAGEHLEDLGIDALRQNSNLKNPIKKNQNPRYHYIEFPDSVVVPDSVIDFKHYFTVSLGWLESNMDTNVCGVDPLFRELISQRFSNYLSRIGLPSTESKIEISENRDLQST